MFASRTGWNLSRNSFSEALDRVRASGRKLLDLTASNPTECGLGYPKELLAPLADAAALHYEPAAKGLLSARQAVCDYYRGLDTPVDVDAEDVFLTTSTSEAYTYVMRLLCEPQDEVLVPHPGYPLFDFLASIQDVKLRPYHLHYDHGWHMDMHGLRQSVTPRTKAIAVVHPNNPTGSFVSNDEAAQLSSMCKQAGLAVIADEVFLDYSLSPKQRQSFAANEDALTFTLSGLSKISGLPQLKFAWCVVSGPKDLKREAVARLEVIADTFLSLNAPVQHAAKTLLNSRHSFQPQLKSRLAANLAELDRQLASQKTCSRLIVDGGWYAVLRVPATRTDEQLALELMETKSVLVHPGHFFDFPQDGYLILSLMTPESDFAEGVAAILSLLAD